MAERPSPVAPLRSMTAFSTITTCRSRPQNLASKAAPQPDMPPPIIKMSHSTVSVQGNSIDCVLWIHVGTARNVRRAAFIVCEKPGQAGNLCLAPLQRRQPIDTEPLRLPGQGLVL